MANKDSSNGKADNGSMREKRGNQSVSQSPAQQHDVRDEGAKAGNPSNPVTADMLKSRDQAIRTNDRK